MKESTFPEVAQSDAAAQQQPGNKAPRPLHVVAIGASAGGLEAIQEFFDNMPSDSGMAFVVVQHLSPDHRSLLTELLSKHTGMLVQEAEDGVAVEPNRVYIIPNKATLALENGRLQLHQKRASKSPNTAVDKLLLSLAEDQSVQRVAIILSGTGTDGSRGIEAIKASGGFVLVQDPATAKFDGMPNSAIATGCADAILAPELMPEALFNHAQIVRTMTSREAEEAVLLETIFALVQRHTQCDFHQYKRPTILRRIGRRMNAGGFQSLAEYVDRLRNDPEEAKALAAEFLIGVTRFFRDQAAFNTLRDNVLPYLERSKGEGDTIKVWVTACCTGEEAYSVAILLAEQLRTTERNLSFKIFATDLDEESLQVAARGVYPAVAVSEIAPPLIERYFIRQGETVQVKPDLRRAIVFARHNIIKDPPFIKNDLITCRNLLIYFTEALQKRTLSSLQFALNPGGYLFLGPSETAGSLREALEEIDGQWKIYAKSAVRPKATSSAPEVTDRSRTPSRVRTSGALASGASPLLEAVRDALTEDRCMAALFIDKNYDVKEATGDFRRFLTLPEKSFGLNLLKMVAPDLSIAIGTALRMVLKNRKQMRVPVVRVRTPNQVRHVSILVTPQPQNDRLLVVLEETTPPETVEALPVFDTPSTHTEQLLDLEAELKETKLSLQTAIEELETTNEELQSSNEELLSANEELQSSNEELQSLNEELHTLNTEHQAKIKELQHLNDDLDNYFSSVDIAQLFLDEHLRVRRFNPSAAKLINLIATDIGRPIAHISDNILHSLLHDDFATVLQDNRTIEHDVELRNGASYQMRLTPYLRADGRRDGLVATFYDVTATRNLNSIISGIFDASQNAIMALHAVRDSEGTITDFRWIAANEAASAMYGRPIEQLIGARLRELYPRVVEKGLFGHYVDAVEKDRTVHFEYPYQRAGGVEGWYDVVAVKMQDGVAATFTDITDKKSAEERLRSNYNQLVTAREDLRRLNTNLEATVTRRTQELSESEERLRLVAKATNDAIYDWDLTTGMEWWSEGLENQFGHSVHLAENNPQFWETLLHPDDYQTVKTSLQQAVNGASGQWNSEYRLRRADGTYAYVLDRASILHDENGIPYRMLGSMLDITAVRDAQYEADRRETEYFGLAEAMPHIVWAAPPDGTIDFYNRHWYEFTGQPREASLENTNWLRYVHADDRPELAASWQRSVATGALYEHEFRLYHAASNSYRWVVARAECNYNSDGTPLRWHGVCLDIHDRKTAADELERRVTLRTAELQTVNEELERSNHDLQQFASVTSHDLKEPLRKIQVFGKLLRDRAEKDEQPGYVDPLNRIVHSSERMTTLINDLLSFSRLSADLPIVATDLNEVLTGILSDLEVTVAERQATVSIAPLPVIQAVPGQMRQLFQNLISNALKFSRTGTTPQIRVDCKRVADRSFQAAPQKDGPYVCLTVADNGIGFNAVYLDKIFTLFQRLHSRDSYEGTGIGLAICKKIVEKHGGIITAESQEGTGSTFYILLPVAGPKHA